MAMAMAAAVFGSISRRRHEKEKETEENKKKETSKNKRRRRRREIMPWQLLLASMECLAAYVNLSHLTVDAAFASLPCHPGVHRGRAEPRR